MEDVALTIKYRSQTHVISIAKSSTLSQLQEKIYDITRVQPAHQKLLAPQCGQRIAEILRSGAAEDVTLDSLQVKDGIRMSVIGATESEIAKVQEQDEKMAVKQKPRQFHPSLLKNSSPRRTPSSSLGPPVFGRCGAHSSTPEGSPLQADVVKYLERLASDPAVLHVCKLHSYQVGLLSELLPHENPELLGLNVNKGEKILLRIRTDEEDGFRDYKTTRRVLMHELAHNEISDHPPEFKILNSQLNREVESFERSRARGTHVLDTTPMYQPVPGRDIEEDLEERRLRILAATEARLAKLDQDIDAGCGSGGANLS